MTKSSNTDAINLTSSEYFINRELSLIEFNKRVILEAADKTHPLLERLKFACILSSNLDEFFMIRVAGLKSQVLAGLVEFSYDGKAPKEQLLEIRRRLLPLYQLQEKILNEELLPEMEKAGIVLHRYHNLTDEDKTYLDEYFRYNILPVLTPLTLAPTNPFPRLINRSLNIAFVLIDRTRQTPHKRVGFLQLPSVLSRFVKLPNKPEHHFILIENVIKAFASTLFPGLEVEATNTFRVTRDADIEIAEDEAEDLLSEIAEQVKQRRWGRAAVRLEVSSFMPDYLINLLMNSLDLEPEDVYILNRPVNLSDFMQLTKIDIRELKDSPLVTRTPPEFAASSTSLFEVIKRGDLLVHHPFDSFSNTVLKFVNDAADDPDVLAIKITLYRTGMNSSIVSALIRAVGKGKYITAFVELKARFDEENNIIWAKELESAGVHVVYGVPGLKTHCKIALVVRREAGKLKTYLHLSTGNYNQVTARLYTDVGFFTANDEFATDAIDLFNYLTGYSHHKAWKHFIVAPLDLHKILIEKIRRETELHTPENPGLIIAKINSLAHRDLIPELYKASKKGVQIKLLCRGVCCLKPGIPNVSENIEVRSVIGRFLEHSRIFYFKNGGDEEYFLSSADWMSRNLHRRVEIMFPIYDPALRHKLKKVLDTYWSDNCKSWRLLSDGTYEKIKAEKGDKKVCAQDYYLQKNSRKLATGKF